MNAVQFPYFPMKNPQLGQVWTTTWQLLVQYGIKQHPQNNPNKPEKILISLEMCLRNSFLSH